MQFCKNNDIGDLTDLTLSDLYLLYLIIEFVSISESIINCIIFNFNKIRLLYTLSYLRMVRLT